MPGPSGTLATIFADADTVDRQPDRTLDARAGIDARDPLRAEVDRQSGCAPGHLAQSRAVAGDDCPLDDRRAREVVRGRGSVVTEAAQLAQPVLELVAQRGIRAGLLVAQRVCLQDPDGREDRDRADDQDADQELDRGAPRDRRLRLPPSAGSRMLLFGGRRSGRRAHRSLIGVENGLLEPRTRAQKFGSEQARLVRVAVVRPPDHVLGGPYRDGCGWRRCRARS